MQKDESVCAVIPINSFDSDESLVLCTKKGVVKKTKINAYKNHRKGGIIGINIDDGDSVLQALRANSSDHLLILTKNGKGLRFSCDQLRDQGRVTRGVRGIRQFAGRFLAQRARGTAGPVRIGHLGVESVAVRHR